MSIQQLDSTWHDIGFPSMNTRILVTPMFATTKNDEALPDIQIQAQTARNCLQEGAKKTMAFFYYLGLKNAILSSGKLFC